MDGALERRKGGYTPCLMARLTWNGIEEEKKDQERVERVERAIAVASGQKMLSVNQVSKEEESSQGQHWTRHIGLSLVGRAK
jgi:hypothetical protein